MPRGRKKPESVKSSGAKTPRKRRLSKPPQVPFAYKLVLNQWLLSLFNVGRFEELAEMLRNGVLEGLDENNIHHFYHALTARFFNLTQLPTEILLEYDQNIVKHTRRLNERRVLRGEKPVVWKYFQYLALLFTEIYLDRYFRDPKALLSALNDQIAIYNTDKREPDQIKPFDPDSEPWPQLNKISFWMATGSGKTLVMHANIMQFLYYLNKYGKKRDLNRIILLTPNEGLSQQHIREFELSRIETEIFSKEGGGLFSGQVVEILEVTKLREDTGEKTIAVDAFESNNLVLVDEGHRGASGGGDGAWMKYRNALCEKGFSFEYSATFGQAVKGNTALTDLYAKNILFDYSYRYFYQDGFGKDYQIMNIQDDRDREWMETYLIACLLSFFQQQRLFLLEGNYFKLFQIEKPLWIFVGSSVTATLAKKDASDIVEILHFFARYVLDRQASIRRIEQILNHGLVTDTGKNLFAGRFTYLNSCGLDAAQIFEETLSTIFNSPGGGQIYVENLKGATGEVALRLGRENKEFGVINVGDDTKLVKLCEQHGFSTGEREFSGSLFQEINHDDSPINILIGSRKFTEGWSSWRVSTMGLMNVGKGEGAQIIQLFGRGVRLKGYNMSLKRSGYTSLPEEIERPKNISALETLGIFGIHADYMAQFRDYLAEEGLPLNDDRIEFLLPVIKNLGTQKLKTIRLKKTINGVSTEFGDAFRKLAPIPILKKPDPTNDPTTDYLQRNQVVLNWYPKIQAMGSGGVIGADIEISPNRAHLSARHVAFLDFKKLYFELEDFKAEKNWYNLNISPSDMVDLLLDQSWYQLLIPENQLEFDTFERVRIWEEIAASLLKKYTKSYYLFRKREWEMPHLEYRDLEENDPNLLGIGTSPEEEYYRILIDKSEEEIIAKLEELKTAIKNGALKPWAFRGIKAISFSRHLYEPLLYVDANVVEISPVPLNKGERLFVEDLKEFHNSNTAFFEEHDLYLLRNLSKGKGVGFFEAGNFHPDFILWLVSKQKQRIIFIDPKGIRNIGPADPKIQFHETIKDIEKRLGDPSINLESFIVSNTPSFTMEMLWRMPKKDMLQKHIVFQEEDKDTYINMIFSKVT